MSITGNDGFKRILGTVPIEKDGSVCIEVPPCKQLHFQLLDEEYRALHTMRSFTNVMPGEQRGCVGCHESHSVAPAGHFGLAMDEPPRVPSPPPWGSYYNLGYERDIQPILDRLDVPGARILVAWQTTALAPGWISPPPLDF